MMKNFSRLICALLLICFLVPSLAYSQKAPKNGKYREKGPDGKVRVEGKYKKGMQHGEWKWYYPSGALEKTETYDKGKRNGPAMAYDAQGKAVYKAFYVNDTLHGSYRSALPGQDIIMGHYTNGKRDSVWTYFFSNGDVRTEGLMKDDKKEGEWRSYSAGKKLNSAINYKEGKEHGLSTAYYREKKTSEYIYENGLKHGPYKMWEEGSLVEEGTYTGGVKQGVVKRYFKDGTKTIANWDKGQLHGKYETYKRDTLYSVAEYKNSYKEGKEIVYFSNGDIERETTYRMNKKNGAERINYKGRKPQREAAYKMDQPDGKWTDWYPSGKVKGERSFVEGVLDGRATSYYESGKIEWTVLYEMGIVKGSLISNYPNGKKKQEDVYENNQVVKIMAWDEKGNKVQDEVMELEPIAEEEIVVTEEEPQEKQEQIFSVVEEMPEFGDGDMMTYLKNNVRYPHHEKEAGIQGTVYIEFTVSSDGSVSDATVIRGVPGGAGLEKEALRVINSFPKFKPGKQGGRPVSVRMTVPIKFMLR